MSAEIARVIRPFILTPEDIVFSDVVEDDYTAWVAGTYAAETWVMHNHRVWQALKETALKPGVAGSENDWNDGGATNYTKLIDSKLGSQTSKLGGFKYQFQMDVFATSIAFLNLVADTVKVKIIDPLEGVVFEKEVATLGAGVINWWQYFFNPIRRKKDVVIDNLPPYAGVVIEIELITASTVEAKLGAIVIGSNLNIGWADWGTSVGIRDWSLKEQDEYGSFDIVKGEWSKRPEFDLTIPTDQVDYIMEELALLASTACVYIGHSAHSMTIAYGYYRELITVLTNYSESECVLTIEALTQ